jgi:large subunit ribosomal protein L6
VSRIGKKPVAVPQGVTVAVRGRTVTVKGPKGELSMELAGRVAAAVEGEPPRVVLRRESDDSADRAKHGLYRALVANMIEGVTKGYERALEIQGVGFRAAVQGTKLSLQVGFNAPKELEIPAGVEVQCPQPTAVVVRGLDKQKVGAFAAKVRAVRPPEPYKGKGIRYRGENVRRLAGKTFGAVK